MKSIGSRRQEIKVKCSAIKKRKPRRGYAETAYPCLQPVSQIRGDAYDHGSYVRIAKKNLDNHPG